MAQGVLHLRAELGEAFLMPFLREKVRPLVLKLGSEAFFKGLDAVVASDLVDAIRKPVA